MLNLFYGEPEGDRWLPFDRYPRRIVRRIVRGKPRPGGQARVFLNLCKGLDLLSVQYRVNDFNHAKHNPRELACIVGKPFLLDKYPWRNPILFGAAVYSHPIDDPDLLTRLPIRKVLVPGDWMKEMCRPMWGDVVDAWPVGIDSRFWSPSPAQTKEFDVLLYDKVRWDREQLEASLIEPIRVRLKEEGRSVLALRYGHYREEEFHAALARCRSMIFLCEHETQGIAYQQALSAGVPIFAWDRGGAWVDPEYYPHRVNFSPVSSVPYWDERCGIRFGSPEEFQALWSLFWSSVSACHFNPRDFILENLTLESCARKYLDFAAIAASGVTSGTRV